MSKARSRRPYLIRAIYDWATDQQLTPHVLVAADYPGVVVPTQYIQDGRITLNISPSAVQNFDVLPDMLWFSARFSGRAFDVQIPHGSVLAIFARENGEGLVFGEIEPPDHDNPAPPAAPDTGGDDASSKPARSHLRVVK